MKPFTPLQSAVANVFLLCFIRRGNQWFYHTKGGVPMEMSPRKQKAVAALWNAVEAERGV